MDEGWLEPFPAKVSTPGGQFGKARVWMQNGRAYVAIAMGRQVGIVAEGDVVGITVERIGTTLEMAGGERWTMQRDRKCGCGSPLRRLERLVI